MTSVRSAGLLLGGALLVAAWVMARPAEPLAVWNLPSLAWGRPIAVSSNGAVYACDVPDRRSCPDN
jgi:hypothetical protein